MNVLIVDEFMCFGNIYKMHPKLDFKTFIKFDITEVIKELRDTEYKCIFISIPQDEESLKTYVKLIKIVSQNTKVYVIEKELCTIFEEELYEIGVDDIFSLESTKVFEHKIHRALNSIVVDSRSTITDLKNQVEVDLISRRVYHNNKLVDFSNKEYQLLVYFLQNIDKIITRTELEVDVWGSCIDGLESRTIDIYIMRIRKLINPYCIDTVRGKGYVWRSK